MFFEPCETYGSDLLEVLRQLWYGNISPSNAPSGASPMPARGPGPEDPSRADAASCREQESRLSRRVLSQTLMSRRLPATRMWTPRDDSDVHSRAERISRSRAGPRCLAAFSLR